MASDHLHQSASSYFMGDPWVSVPVTTIVNPFDSPKNTTVAPSFANTPMSELTLPGPAISRQPLSSVASSSVSSSSSRFDVQDLPEKGIGVIVTATDVNDPRLDGVSSRIRHSNSYSIADLIELSPDMLLTEKILSPSSAPPSKSYIKNKEAIMSVKAAQIGRFKVQDITETPKSEDSPHPSPSSRKLSLSVGSIDMARMLELARDSTTIVDPLAAIDSARNMVELIIQQRDLLVLESRRLKKENERLWGIINAHAKSCAASTTTSPMYEGNS